MRSPVWSCSWQAMKAVTARAVFTWLTAGGRLTEIMQLDASTILGFAAPDGVNHPLFAKVRALIDKGRTWVKLSGAYADTKIGPPSYSDSSAVARAYAKAAPERCVWGSDWPHPGEQSKQLPDDALLFDLLTDWVPDERVRHRILVDNPASLYDFATG